MLTRPAFQNGSRFRLVGRRSSQGAGVSPGDSAARRWMPATRYWSCHCNKSPGFIRSGSINWKSQRVSPDRSSYEILLDSLPPRNVLVLEIESPLAHGRTDPETADWGCIALVIRTRADCQTPPEPV